MATLFANSGDPDQTPRSAASDLGLHCLPITLLRVSRLQWVKYVRIIALMLILENIAHSLLSKSFGKPFLLDTLHRRSKFANF